MRMETGSPLSRLSSSLSIFHNSNTLPFPMRCPLAERVVNTTVLRVVSSTSAPGRKHSKERTSGDNLSKTSSTGAKTGRLRSVTSGSRTGRFNGTSNKEKLNLEISPHRAVSAVRLMRIQLGGAFADLLNEQGKGSGDNEMGYVERTLGFRTRDLDDRDLRLILRIGFYEIVKLEMPPYAVVDENVKLAKVALRPGAGNMVNAVLRKLVLLKETNSLPSPKVEGDDRQQARALATIHSHPVWMVRRWTNYLGLEEAIKLMTWNNSDPCYSLRANTAKGFTRADLVTELEMLKVPYELSQHLDDFVRLKTGMQIVIQAGLLKKGFCSVQDESAGLVVTVVDPKPGEIIIDCCAAPGGKTLFMASCLKGQGTIYAIDVNKGRLRILKETAKLHEVNNVVTIHADLRAFAENNCTKADKVLLDAPCSGLGVLSKRADLRWNRTLEDMEQLTNLQDELLDSASTLVRPGGVLIYSTCSIDPEENQERIAAFLLRHPEFCIDPVDKYVPCDFVTVDGFYSSNPVKHSLDGAFAARLLRSR
ncbi:putative ribosomal RNA small subunit methyltransferase B [Sesamum angolense]|uniref:Ribosomal RNA small subunit methyltransferase B n=1 Tax=Sesamum angolense TaxID=2727404 RepID=A0AAE2BUU7_9LAMI|nr:putative ribosomal RNA small subunit methyltransferase B [Sesamum angolense]